MVSRRTDEDPSQDEKMSAELVKIKDNRPKMLLRTLSFRLLTTIKTYHRAIVTVESD